MKHDAPTMTNEEKDRSALRRAKVRRPFSRVDPTTTCRRGARSKAWITALTMAPSLTRTESLIVNVTHPAMTTAAIGSVLLSGVHGESSGRQGISRSVPRNRVKGSLKK